MKILTSLKHFKKQIIFTWKLWFTRNYFIQFFPKSFAQAGEDCILGYLLNELQIKNPTYLDLGANYPIAYNNTYFLYIKGCKGVCVEADPSLVPELKKYRKNDTILNVGVGVTNAKEAEFYVYSAKGLNTFSKTEVEYREKTSSLKVEKIIKVPLKTINEIIQENFESTPNLLSIDIEGMDLEILKNLDFSKHKPEIICAETISYSEGREARKIFEIIDYVCSKGYIVYADTHINTIFALEEYYPHLKVRTSYAFNP